MHRALLMAAIALSFCLAASAAEKPNVIFILADDLGYGDVGCYGQKQIQTPNIDRMAAEGLRFTQAYAGSTVCAPSRCSLMTGLHQGHARIRGNARVPLEPGDVTVAEVLRQAGYQTGLVGKWGLGNEGTTGTPTKQGFDYFYGYLDQHHAHNYYPDFLWRNDERVQLENVVQGGVASKKVVYSPDLFKAEALEFLDRHRKGPFFLYFAATLPHANNEAGKEGMEIPSDAPYSKETWPAAQKNHAAMISRLDADVGLLLAKLKTLGIDEKTLVIFTSDNGPHREGGGDPSFFNSSGPLTGIKRSMTEGGIRVPFIARWPGKIEAGEASQPVVFYDILPTLAEVAGAKSPTGIDGVSIVPTLLGAEAAGRPQPQHDFLYWEFHEGGSKQAVRMGNWKAIRSHEGPLQLFDLATDLAETKNIAAEHPDVVAKIETYLATCRTESPDWPLQAGGAKKKPAAVKP